MSVAPFLIVEQNRDTALQWANQQLVGAGLRTVRTFDLQDARTGSHDCSCPHHGTENCDYMFDLLPEKDFIQVLKEFKRVLKPAAQIVLVNMTKGAHFYKPFWETVYRINPRW